MRNTLIILLFAAKCCAQVGTSNYNSLFVGSAADFMTATRLGDFPGTSVDSRHGDTLNEGGVTVFYGMGGVTGEPQVENRDIWRYTPSTDTWDSIGQMPFPSIEAYIRTINNKIYLLEGNKDSLWSYDGTTFTLVSQGMPRRNSYNFGVTSDNRGIIQGGTDNVTHFTDVIVFDTLGTWEVVADTTFGATTGATGNMALFKGQHYFCGGGILYTPINNNGWSTADDGVTWTNLGTSPLRLFWSDFEKITDDYALLCCGYSQATENVATTFVTGDLIDWQAFPIAWQEIHAGTMFNIDNVLYRVWGRHNGAAPNYSFQVWKVEYTP